jgi:hypothetical protein
MKELEPLLRVDARQVELQARAALLLEATVLHELVHYGRRKLHGYKPSARERAAEEYLAREFERKAYGRFVTATSLQLAQFMPRTAWADLHTS